jgi:hypothetical protein
VDDSNGAAVEVYAHCFWGASNMKSIFAILLVALAFSAAAKPADSDPNQSDALWDSLVSLLEADAPRAQAPAEEPDELEPLIDTLIIEDVETADPNQAEPSPEPNAQTEDPNYTPEPQAVPAPAPLYPGEPAPSTIYAFGRSWTVDILGSAAFGDSQGELYGVHASFETPFWGDWTLALQPFAGVGVGKEDEAVVLAFDQVLKYPVWTNGPMKVNFEGGGGLQQAGPDSWPDDSTHFNFRTILGGGLEYETAQYQKLLFGARWLHVGNLDIDKDKNPELNELMLYGGWRLRF